MTFPWSLRAVKCHDTRVCVHTYTEYVHILIYTEKSIYVHTYRQLARFCSLAVLLLRVVREFTIHAHRKHAITGVSTRTSKRALSER